MKYRYLNTDVYVEEQGDRKISLLQASSMYPLSKFYSEEGITQVATNCSYFTTSYVLGRNQGDTYNEAPDQDFYSVVVKDDNSYVCDVLASWEARDNIIAGFSPAVVLMKNGLDVELISRAISDASSRPTVKNPNTAFGFKKDGKAILVVNSGRSSSSAGLTGRELRTFLKSKYDLDLLVLLDGGGSTEMIVNGEIQFTPSDGSERKMWNALAFVDTKATQYATLPIRHTGITQGINGSFSHVGTKAIDFGFNTGYQTQELYAPFDCKVVWADTVTKGGTVALQSLKPVKWVNGEEDFMTVISEHSNDRPEQGKIFKQGEVYAHMGNAGNVAYHTHIEVQRGKYKRYTGTRYQSGIKGYVYMFPNTVEPYNALYLAKDAVMNEGDIQYSWKRITDVISPQERNTNVDQVKVLVDLLRVRSDHLTAAEMIGYAQKDGYYNDLAVYDDGTYTWHKIADDQWIADGGDWVEVLPGVNGEMIDLRDTIVNLQETVSRLQLDIENKDALIKKIQDSLDSALSENRKLQLMYDDLLEDHDKAVAMYETLSQKYTITIAKIQTAYEKLLEAFKEVLP